jgi:hypothetical protein
MAAGRQRVQRRFDFFFRATLVSNSGDAKTSTSVRLESRWAIGAEKPVDSEYFSV